MSTRKEQGSEAASKFSPGISGSAAAANTVRSSSKLAAVSHAEACEGCSSSDGNRGWW